MVVGSGVLQRVMTFDGYFVEMYVLFYKSIYAFNEIMFVILVKACKA